MDLIPFKSMDYCRRVLVEIIVPLLLVFGLELYYRESLFETTLVDVPEM